MSKKLLTIDEQKQELLQKIGKEVTFSYPDNNRGKRKGLLKHRSVIFAEDFKADGIVYWDILDIIRFDGEPEDEIRFTYYRYKYKGGTNLRGKPIKLGWNFAGQNSFCEPISKVKELLNELKNTHPEICAEIGLK